MKAIDWKKLLPHIIAIVCFIVLAAVFSKPALEGKVLYQHDIVQYEGGSRDIANYAAKHGQPPLWTNGMFSGMPTYQIWMPGNNVLPHYLNTILTLGLPQPMQFFFLACILFYFLSQVARVNPYVGMFGSFAFAYSTFNPVMIAAGHVTQMWCVAYMPAILASVILIYRKQYLIGSALLALFTATQIGLNHLQVSYYLFIILAFYTIACLVQWIRAKDYGHIAKALGATLAAGLIGVLVNSVTLFTTYEYSKETIRGGSLSIKDTAATKGTGLTKDYAFEYSYEPLEGFTLMFPRIFGGSGGIREFGEDAKVNQALSEINPQIAQNLNGIQNSYWGALSYTAGPPYLGVTVCFLFILFLFLIPGEIKWWILGTSLLALLLSWGKYFSGFNYFLFDHLPLYNKFRAPSMSLIIPQLLWSFAAILALQHIISNAGKPETWKKLKTAGYATAIVFALAFLAYLSLDYLGRPEIQLKNQVNAGPEAVKSQVISVINALVEDRKGVFLRDLFKGIALIGVFFAVLAMYTRGKLTGIKWVTLTAIGLVLIDLLPVDNTYLNKSPNGESSWSEKEESKQELVAGMADLAIMKDSSWYRVLNLSVSPFSDASTSNFHKSIGGYHAAKIGRYQDLYEHKLTAEIDALRTDTLAQAGFGLRQSTYTALNMLNTKYIIGSNPSAISNQAPFYITNLNALGPCWFVRELRFAPTLQEEMKGLNGLNAAEAAIVPEADKAQLSQPQADSTARIELVKNDNDIITYKSSAASGQFAVFSEIYYPEGWNAYIDGKAAPYVKVNYVLRGMNVPAGQHTIEFKFEPASFSRGKTLTNFAQIAVLLLLAIGVFMEFRKKESVA